MSQGSSTRTEISDASPPGAAASGDPPIERAFAVIEHVIDAGRAVTATEIAEALTLPTPSVHRIAVQLIDRGILRRALGSKRLLPGPRLIDMGVRTVRAAVGDDPAHAILAALAREIGEHCQIGVVTGGEVIYVDSVRAQRSASLHFEPGRHAPVHCTSIGKLYLARLDDAALDRMLGSLALDRFTPSTLCDAASLRAAVIEVRRRGWASNAEEYVPGVVGCAVPILAPRGRLLAGLGISVPMARMSFDSLTTFVPIMQAAATRIAQAIGTQGAPETENAPPRPSAAHLK